MVAKASPVPTSPPSASSTLSYERGNLSDRALIELYEAMLFPRLIEERMLNLLRQGKISKWFSGIGQEAIAAGVSQILQPQDTVFPLHRNLGIFVGRGMPLSKLMAQWLGRLGGYTKGRDRSFHFGSPSEGVIGMISHLGAMLGVADGLALAHQLDGSSAITLAFSGDGGPAREIFTKR